LIKIKKIKDIALSSFKIKKELKKH